VEPGIFRARDETVGIGVDAVEIAADRVGKFISRQLAV
jgi:hypothetical protein